MNTKQQTIDIQIPNDGYPHKYIHGKTPEGKEIIFARPHGDAYYHRDLVSMVGEPLENVTGGYVESHRDLYFFSGSSSQFGRANHRKIDYAVNGSNISTRVKKVATAIEQKVKDEIEDIRFDMTMGGNRVVDSLKDKAIGTSVFGSLACLIGYSAIKGYCGLPLDTQSDSIAAAPYIASGLLTIKERRSNGEGPIEVMVTQVVGGAVFAGIGYGIGAVIREINS